MVQSNDAYLIFPASSKKTTPSNYYWEILTMRYWSCLWGYRKDRWYDDKLCRTDVGAGGKWWEEGEESGAYPQENYTEGRYLVSRLKSRILPLCYANSFVGLLEQDWVIKPIFREACRDGICITIGQIGAWNNPRDEPLPFLCRKSDMAAS